MNCLMGDGASIDCWVCSASIIALGEGRACALLLRTGLGAPWGPPSFLTCRNMEVSTLFQASSSRRQEDLEKGRGL